MSYDPKCYDLAALWLAGEAFSDVDRSRAVRPLAQAIQDAIEDWLEFEWPQILKASGE